MGGTSLKKVELRKRGEIEKDRGMKKFFNSIFILLFITCACLLVGCNDRYGNLRMSLSFSFSPNAENVEVLNDGTYRVVTSGGVFDARRDGSYVIYIDNDSARIPLDIVYTNAPSDFNYDASFAYTSEAFRVDESDVENISNGIRVVVVASSEGQGNLVVRNSESGISSSIYIEVVKVSDTISFRQDNLALSVEERGSVDFSSQIVGIPQGQDFTLEFGSGSVDNFDAFTSEELRLKGFSYNANTKILTLSRTNNIDITSLLVKATYDSPLGEELVSYTTIRILPSLTNFEVYLGSSADDVVEENRLSDTSLLEFVFNMGNGLNYVDLILKVNSNGEKIEFDVLQDSLYPFLDLTTQPMYDTEYIYYDASGEEVDSYQDATFTYAYYRLQSNKKTEGTGYENDLYTLVFTCDYSDYSVSNYPITTSVMSTVYSLIQEFEINGTTIPHFSFEVGDIASIIDAWRGDFYPSKLYINTSEDLYGEEFVIDVSDPTSIDLEDAKYYVEFYDGAYNRITTPSQYFTITYEYNGVRVLNDSDFNSTFDQNGIFYVKPNADVSEDLEFYMVLRAEKPEESNQTTAVIYFETMQGVSEISSYDFTNYTYEVDDEGNYVLDDEGNKIITNTGETGVEFVLHDTNSKLYIGSEDINIDLNVGRQVEVSLNTDYPPEGSLQVTSSNTNVARVINDGFGDFLIEPLSSGSSVIEITLPNLSFSYQINVNVFSPISLFYVTLSNTTYDKGVGEHIVDVDNVSTKSAVVETQMTFNFVFLTKPDNQTQYDLFTYVYYDENDNGIIDEVEGEITDSLVPSLGGLQSHIYQDSYFSYNTRNRSFTFLSDEGADRQYIIRFEIHNLDGAILTKDVLISGYVPIRNVLVESSSPQVFTSSAIYYGDKILDSEELSLRQDDPSIFGIRVSTNINSNRIPTYNFDNYGVIELEIGGVVYNRYNVSGGTLVAEFKHTNSPFVLLSSVTNDGYYWFRLDESYRGTNESVLVRAYVREFNRNSYENNLRINIVSPSEIGSIESTDGLDINFRQGIDSSASLNIQVTGNNIFNDNLVYGFFAILESNGETKFIAPDENSGLYTLNLTKTYENNFRLDLGLSMFYSGTGVIVVLPEDKINDINEYNIWNESLVYEEYNVSLDNFIAGLFYTEQAGNYILATEYDEEETYYIRTVNFYEKLSIWDGVLVLNISISDGINVPYHVSTYEELVEIGSSIDSASKNYVLTRDIELPTDLNWASIGNYYLANVESESDFLLDTYYTQNEDGSFAVSDTYEEETIYYGYGFNGTLSGKYVLYDYKTNQEITQYYGINNVRFVGSNTSTNVGILSRLGVDGVISDLSIEYSYYQPTTSTSGTFGGLVGENRGEINNVKVRFSSYRVTVNNSEDDEFSLSIGGIAGINYGVIENSLVSDVVAMEGIINVDLMTTDDNVYVGGLVGSNYGTIIGSYNTENDTQYTFNDIGYDSSLTIRVTGETMNGGFGGVAGYNAGTLQNLALQGEINAENSDNVGGLVGYNTSGSFDYSVERSYMSGKVQGRNNVGGVIGQALRGNFYNISAENYATNSNSSRTFIRGVEDVGGLIGYASNVSVEYSYSVSYFNSDSISNDNATLDSSYDIVGEESIGGLIGFATNSCTIINSASYLNVRGESEVSNFIGFNNASSISSCFAIGCIYSVSGAQTNPIETRTNSYSVVYDARASHSYVNGVLNGTVDQIRLTNTDNVWGGLDTDGSPLEDDTPPYLLFEGGALIATSQISISINVKDNEGGYISYIKAGDNSAILFYGRDEFNSYSGATITEVNTIKITDLIDLVVDAPNHKTTRFDVRSSDSSVLTVNSNGDIRVVGEGNAVITISSKLNSSIYAQIEVVVSHGLTGFEVYANASMTSNIDGASLELVKSQALTLYSESEYIRAVSGQEVNLMSYENAGIRFIVETGDPSDENNLLEQLYDALGLESEDRNIRNIIRIGDSVWNEAEGYYYVDIDYSSLVTLTPLLAFDVPLSISYIPYIEANFNNEVIRVQLDEIGQRTFTVTANNGATDIIFENNILSTVEINQLEYFSFTVTVMTDYDGEDIASNIGTIEDENFGYNISSNKVISYDENNNIKSVSRTYTVWYNDRTTTLDTEKIYNLSFWPVTNTAENQINLTVIVHGQNGVSDISTRIYADVNTDFPQNPSDSNIIYNGRTALLAFEVYPYFANYSRLRISYNSSANYSFTLSQLYYNSSGTGDKFSVYSNSGAIFDENGALIVQKTSGQDSAGISSNGVYSYSRMYFFGVLIPSNVPDRTSYVVTIDVLDSNNNVILTKDVSFTTLARSDLNLSFGEEYLGEDSVYYLPANTRQELSIATTNEYETIEFEITSPDYTLTETTKEIFMPIYDNGRYYVDIMNYANNLFTTDLIGKTITITATIDGGETTDPSSLSFVITLFTVTDISASDVSQGYMTLQNSVTTPLKVAVSASFDESVLSSTSNWYSEWYLNFGTDESNSLYRQIVNAGYEVQENFINYISLLEDSITKANYNSNETSENKISGVWLYVDSANTLSPLRSGRMYNNNAFGVENYRDYIAVYGYETDRNSNLRLNVRLSYSYYDATSASREKISSGVANVRDYNFEYSMYQSNFTFVEEFILSFVDRLSLNNPTPVSSASEFLSLALEEGGDFRLVNDIELTNYTPFDINVNSFDGNNYNIYITSFASNEESTQTNLGLFNVVGSSTMIYNTTVYFTNRVDASVEAGRLTPRAYPLTYNVTHTGSVNFGGIAVTNNGIITNCSTSGSLTLNVTNASIDSILNGGLVATNASSGFITNSKVKDFIFTCYGRTGGFVGMNSGKIVASYFDNSSISNLSTGNVGGFVYQNDGSIYECFSQGARSSTDNDIRNTGDGITSDGGNVGGFVYRNNSQISDCYSNILISTSSIMAGFVYEDSTSSKISKSYSISCKRTGDNETTAFPFLGPSTEFTPLRVVVNGVMNNCYYLTTGGTWANSNFYIPNSNNPNETPMNKKAVALETDDFATHDSFINFDLSLVYNTDRYEDMSEYNYVDGYTWVIVGGKPLLVSTLTDTISQQDYQGKQKNYESVDLVYFDLASLGELYVEEQRVGIGSSEILTNYYLQNSTGIYSESDIVYSTLRNNNTNTLTYDFRERNGNSSLSIVCNIITNEDGSESFEFVNAEYGDGTILDIRTNIGDVYYDSDENFRANDTIVIERNEETNEILRITYRELQSASYYYSSSVQGVSDVLGSRTNPKIIYDYESFSYWLTETSTNKTTNNFYRFVSDINLNNNFVSTSRSIFKGVLQGNYMIVDNLSISYFNTNVTDTSLNSTSFGLFAGIETARDSTLDTVISNLTINVGQVLSNAHMFVGALAGEISASEKVSSHKVFLANINIGNTEGTSPYVMGGNAVGGLAGIATGYVIIKDITSSVSVNASYDAPTSIINSTLYKDKDDEYISRVSYAGGVVGIFDVTKVIDTATLRNYNANNVIVTGDNTFVGNIVGSAFGLVGENSIVNYTNAYLSHSDTTFIRATSYGGGLVGENRGTIISSSTNYLDENNLMATDGIGESSFSEFDLFFSGLGGEVNAIGGLIGLNNGGLVTNSISNINVRNRRAEIAGGLVGRMLEGALVNSVASGSVVSDTIMGGFIGSLNDRQIMIIEGEYDEDTLIAFDLSKYTDFYGSFAEGENKNVIISSCVSANNWLANDYSYYTSIMQNGGALSGFIGVISYYDEENNIDVYENMSFLRPSYYANTLYTTINGSTPALYLQSTYISSVFDEAELNNDSPNILLDSSGEQAVYPYSTSEFYYESQGTKVTYSIRVEDNLSSNIGGEHDVYADVFYIIEDSNPEELMNNDNLYTLINYDENGNWDTPYERRNYEWYVEHFGYIYYINENGQYVLVNDSDEYETLEKIDGNTYREFYYIASPILSSFSFVEEYTSSEDDIFIYGNAAAQGTRVNEYTFESIDDLKAQNYISVNGLRIPIDLTDEENSIVSEVYADEEQEIFVSGEYEYTGFSLPLVNGGTITSIKFTVASYNSANVVRAYIDRVELTYEYNDIGYQNLDNENVFVSLESSQGSANTIVNYSLIISSKKVIYSAYRNGYWEMDDNFLLDTISNVTKFPVNLELAEKYVWSDFRSSSASTDIYTAEDLAAFAYAVNTGVNSYENRTVTLHNDIDLSGKYWVPIGSESYPFKGTFNGNGYSIKYVSVNENSIKDGNGTTLPEYAGLFGYVDGGTIYDLSILGGEVSGEYAGGLVAKAVNTEIYNITNRNNSLGVTASGGIVGEMTGGRIYNTINYARVESMSSETRISSDVYVGGIIGNAENVYLSFEDTSRVLLSNTNYGEIYTYNARTNYITNNLINIYIGGIIGRAENVVSLNGATNEGNISVTSNANGIYVGGVVGYITSPFTGESISFSANLVEDVKNNGDVSVTNSNAFSASDLNEDSLYVSYAKCDVGGVFGYADLSVSLSSNKGDIILNTISSTEAKIALGGVIGRVGVIRRGNEDNQAEVGGVTIRQSNNIGNIESYSTNASTFGIGGLIGVSDLSYYITNSSDEGNERTKDKVQIQDSYNAGEVLSSNNCLTFLGGILGYAYATNVVSNRVLIARCLNVGSVTIYNISRITNALGAIVGVDDFIFTSNPHANTNVTADTIDSYVPNELFNFYLRGSAYSGGTNYSAMTEYSASTSYYVPVDDIDTFAISRISDSLKDEENYQIELVIDDITYVVDVWNFESIWIRQYDTWYPTLRDNLATAFWTDNVTEVQSTGTNYSVGSPEELAYMASKINSGEIDSEGIVINLTSSLDLSNKFWTPIGTSEYPFKGTFNGNLYEIKNLTVDGEYMDNVNYGGLFGVVESATIRNVGLANLIIKNVTYAGGVVANANNSLITMVYTENENSEDSIVEGTYVAGGIVGVLSNSASLSESTRKGLYFAYNNTKVGVDTEYTGLSIIGGLVGSLEGSYIGNAYNSENGVIVVRDASVGDGAFVVGQTDVTSKLLNVFNLSSLKLTSDGSSTEISDKRLFYITVSTETGAVEVLGNGEPTFEGLSINELSNLYLGDPSNIWTKEYSLNNDELSSYPTLRGLGKEWKNTESETLTSFDVSEDFETSGRSEILTYVDSITRVDGEDVSLTKEIDKTLVSFSSESFSNVSVNTIYLITSEEELVWLANNVNSGALLTSNSEFILMSDLDLTGRYWTPIGVSAVYPFSGIFNFNGHVIKGLTIDNSGYSYAGLFGYTKNAYIVNGYLEGMFIKITNESLNSEIYAGSVVGFGDNTTIKNMYVSTSISVYSNSAGFVGGIAGYLKGTNYAVSNVNVSGASAVDLGEFSSCVAEVKDNTEVTENNIHMASFSDSGRVFIGGVVGYIVGPEEQENNFNVVEYAVGAINIAGVSRSSSSNVYAGGIIGYAAEFLTLNASSSSGIIKTYSAKFDLAGGIVGYNNDGIIRNCMFTGYLETRQSSGRDNSSSQIWSYVGGIVGSTRGGLVENCIMNGRTLSAGIGADYSVGTIIGYGIDIDYSLYNTDPTTENYVSTDCSVYYENAGFNGTEPVGVHSFEGIVEPDNLELLISQIFTNEPNSVSGDNSPFISSYWQIEGNTFNLRAQKVFVIGAGRASFTASFENETKPLLSTGQSAAESSPGLYIDRDRLGELELTLPSNGGSIGVSVVTRNASNNLVYHYIELQLNTLSSSGESFNLSECLSGIKTNEIVSCFITYIE